jgi:hypothetical protein
LVHRGAALVTKIRCRHLNQKFEVADTILFPFKSRSNFNNGYAWSMELAHKMNTFLAFFTLITADYAEEEREAAYHALMEAHGHYVQYYQVLNRKVPKIRSKRIILPGVHLTVDPHFTNKLIEFLAGAGPHLIVLQPELFSKDDLSRIAKASEPTIILPEMTRSHEFDDSDPDQSSSHVFYDILRRSQLINMEEGFFNRIAKDTSLFNYLFSIFRHKDPH